MTRFIARGRARGGTLQCEQKSACQVHSTPLHLAFCRYDRALKAAGDRRCKTRTILFPLSGAALVSIQAKSLRSQALHLVFKRFSFLSQSCVLGFLRIGGAQFFQCLFDRPQLSISTAVFPRRTKLTRSNQGENQIRIQQPARQL